MECRPHSNGGQRTMLYSTTPGLIDHPKLSTINKVGEGTLSKGREGESSKEKGSMKTLCELRL